MSDRKLEIIDPHIHLWDPASTPRPARPYVKLFGWNARLLELVPRITLGKPVQDFLGGADHLVNPYLPDDYAAGTGKHRITGYVHVQAGWKARGPLGDAGETRWLELADSERSTGSPELLGVVGHADLRDTKHLDALLDAHVEASPRFVGIRDMVARSAAPGVHDWPEHGDVLHDPTWRAGFDRLQEHGFTFDAWCYSEQLADLVEFLRSRSGARVVVDHVASPVGWAGPHGRLGESTGDRRRIDAQWRRGIEALAAVDGVHIKFSGLAMPILGFAWHERPTRPGAAEVAESFRPLFEHVVSCFGAERVMLASNFPMDSVSLSLETLYDAYDLLTADLSNAERRQLFSQTARSFYSL